MEVIPLLSEEKRKDMILRMPTSIHSWLKENVKSQSINDFIVGLIEARIEARKKPTQEEKPIETSTSQWTQDMEALWQERYNFQAKYRDKFQKLEDRWFELRFGDSGYVGEEQDWQKAVSEFPHEVAEYFEKVETLPHPTLQSPKEANLRSDFLDRIYKEQEEKLKQEEQREYGGDPDEVIW
jgi:hypothetical protein